MPPLHLVPCLTFFEDWPGAGPMYRQVRTKLSIKTCETLALLLYFFLGLKLRSLTPLGTKSKRAGFEGRSGRQSSRLPPLPTRNKHTTFQPENVTTQCPILPLFLCLKSHGKHLRDSPLSERKNPRIHAHEMPTIETVFFPKLTHRCAPVWHLCVGLLHFRFCKTSFTTLSLWGIPSYNMKT